MSQVVASNIVDAFPAGCSVDETTWDLGLTHIATAKVVAMG